MVMKKKTSGYNVDPYMLEDGHLYVTLRNPKTGEEKQARVCDLVWESFKGKIPNGYEVTHINGNKEDNNLTNLTLKKVFTN